MLPGCESKPDNRTMPGDEQALKELAAIYRDFVARNKRGPKNAGELERKGQGFPNAMQMVKSGELIVQWGASTSPDRGSADAVLAYIVTVPEQGGSVLMQDGNTIKRMTADEFKTARKAAGR